MPTSPPQETTTLVIGFPGGLHCAMVFPPIQLPLKHPQATGLPFQKVFLLVTRFPELSKVIFPPMASTVELAHTAPFCWMSCMVQGDPTGLPKVGAKPLP